MYLQFFGSLLVHLSSVYQSSPTGLRILWFFCKLGTPPFQQIVILLSFPLSLNGNFGRYTQFSDTHVKFPASGCKVTLSTPTWSTVSDLITKKPINTPFLINDWVYSHFSSKKCVLFLEKKTWIGSRLWLVRASKRARLAGMVGFSELQRVWTTGWIEHQEVRLKAAKTRGVANRIRWFFYWTLPILITEDARLLDPYPNASSSRTWLGSYNPTYFLTSHVCMVQKRTNLARHMACERSWGPPTSPMAMVVTGAGTRSFHGKCTDRPQKKPCTAGISWDLPSGYLT